MDPRPRKEAEGVENGRCGCGLVCWDERECGTTSMKKRGLHVWRKNFERSMRRVLSVFAVEEWFCLLFCGGGGGVGWGCCAGVLYSVDALEDVE